MNIEKLNPKNQNNNLKTNIMTNSYNSKIKKSGLLLTLMAMFFLSTTLVQAQNTTTEIAKKTDVDYTSTALTVDGSIKLIDNKGTIKYIQSSNGLTTLTNTSGTNVTTTTFQLGGTLTDDTYIDVNGNVLGLDGISLIDTATETASTNATTESDHGTGSGYTLLARDEATGAVKKLLISDLNVVGSQQPFTATAGQTDYALTGAPELTLFKTYVYRNGAKLVAGTDYTLSATTGTVTLDTDNFPVFAEDVIEIHYLN